MRFNEFKDRQLTAYTVVIALSDHKSVQTIIYADSLSDAWLIASRQYGRENLVSVNPTYQQSEKQKAIKFWKDRWLKFARLALPSPRAKTFDEIAKELPQASRNKLTAKVKADKAKWELRNITKR